MGYGLCPTNERGDIRRSTARRGTGAGAGSIRVTGSKGEGVRVKNPSVLVYDVANRGFTTFRGVIGIENPQSAAGVTTPVRAINLHLFRHSQPPGQQLCESAA